jgi:hypothetical protein
MLMRMIVNIVSRIVKIEAGSMFQALRLQPVRKRKGKCRAGILPGENKKMLANRFCQLMVEGLVQGVLK